MAVNKISRPTYKVAYSFYDERRSVVVNSLMQVKEGFWVNAKGDITNKSDCVTWIPPSRLICVDKIIY